MTHNTLCPICGSPELKEVFKINTVPAHCCILWEDRQQAMNCPKGSIQLTFCNDCGHLFNSSFQNTLMDYTEDYENSLHFSPKFQEYSWNLIKRLTQAYQLYDKTILEIGCGKGDFLKMITDYGHNKGYGFDKSYQPDLDKASTYNGVTYIKDYYSEEYATFSVDFIVTRFVLEHINHPCKFLEKIKILATSVQKNEIIFYFEVPNILYTLRDMGIWDLIYEHFSHFSMPSLVRLFEKLGFQVIQVRENYGGQFLSVEASTHNNAAERHSASINVKEVHNLVEKFSDHFHQKIHAWQQSLENLKKQGKQAVVWGGGAKGVSFLNFLNTANTIHHVVDINPRKTGKYIAGTGQKYILPKDLKRLKTEVVIVMNPIYKKEIEHTLNELNLAPEIWVA